MNKLDEEIADIIRNNLIKNRAETLQKISNNKKSISKINSDIQCLMLARNALLKDNVNLTSTIIGCFHFLCCKYEDLKNEFNKSHFESEKVRNAVMQLRRIFFDDRKEMFQKYNCVDIDFSDPSYCNSTGVAFTFSNGEREFSLVIPTMLNGSSEIQRTENAGGNIHFTFWLNEHYCSSSHGSLDINEVRKDIEDFITSKSMEDFNKTVDRKYQHDVSLSDIYNSYINGHDLIYSSYSCTYHGDKYYQYSTCSQ